MFTIQLIKKDLMTNLFLFLEALASIFTYILSFFLVAQSKLIHLIILVALEYKKMASFRLVVLNQGDCDFKGTFGNV